VPVQAKLGVVGKVRAELQKERPEVPIETVEIVVIHQSGRFHDPCVALMGSRVMPFLGAVDGALLLRLAHEDDSVALGELRLHPGCQLILALPFLESHHRNPPEAHDCLGGHG